MRTLLSYWWNLFIVWVKTYCQIKIVHFRQTDGRTWRPKGSNSQKSFSFLNNCRQRALKIFGYDQVDLSFSVWICKMKYHFLDSWYRYNLNSVLNTAFNSYFNQKKTTFDIRMAKLILNISDIKDIKVHERRHLHNLH